MRFRFALKRFALSYSVLELRGEAFGVTHQEVPYDDRPLYDAFEARAVPERSSSIAPSWGDGSVLMMSDVLMGDTTSKTADALI
jgi:hypothetical protein